MQHGRLATARRYASLRTGFSFAIGAAHASRDTTA
jgi:hypothetical protein